MKKEIKNWTLIDIIRWGTDYFQEKGIDSPRLTIELLLSKILKCERISLYTSFDKPLSDDELGQLREIIRRRINREPLQFILGTTKFYNTELYIDSSSIVPRPETEILVQSVDDYLKHNNNVRKVLDIGTGCGCIAVSLAKEYPEIEFTAIDISSDALMIAEKNADYNSISNINFLELDIINQIPDEKFDLIVSNPPYIPLNDYMDLEPEVLNYEPMYALTDDADGLTFFRRFSEIFQYILNDSSVFFFEIGYDQAEVIKKMFKEKGFKLSFLKDWNGFQRIAFGQSDIN